jgi:alkylation response protein AidB-like acyl-CoA dehydrogenase
LAGSCLSTWFVIAQHQTPTALVRGAPEPLRSAVLPLLESATSIAGIAFSHLRRWPQSPVEVEPCGTGWRFTGTAPWYTGWGVNDLAVIAGVSRAGEVVFGLVPAEAHEGLRPGRPLDTVAVSAARTVPVLLDGLVVPEQGVLAVTTIEAWRHNDRAKTANVTPSVFGVTQAAVDRLAERGPSAQEAAGRLGQRMAAVRREAYALIDEVEAHDELDRRIDLRAAALATCVQACSALVASRGGRAMLRTDDAQLLARWAMFLTVQAQTPPVREALLRHLTSG